MPAPEAAEAHYAAQRRHAEAALILAGRQWRLMDDDLETSWARIVRRLTLIVASAQLGAARSGAEYVPAVLAEIGADVDPAGSVRPQGWAGVASDGRPLGSLLYASVVHARGVLGTGQKLPQALAGGRKHLDMLVRTQVADASRGAAGVAIAARPGIGWTRMVSAPCCQRCAVLAGKRFRYNDGFLRHPRCDCRHIPVGQDFERFTSEVRPAQVRDLTEAQRQAVEDGADLNQVINTHRKGARSADGMTTSEGTSRRGVAGARGVKRRLTPEAAYRVSATREEALERLKQHGYLV